MIVVIGEALVDVVDRGDGAPQPHVGGSPLNVATGLARLDVPVQLGATIGSDEHGTRIRAHLLDNGVELVELAPPAAASSVALARLDTEGAASYEFRIIWAPERVPPLPSGACALHTGSLATALAPGASAVREAIERERARGAVTLTYDPNIRPGLLGDRDAARAEVEAIVRLVDVVKASSDDLAWLYPGERDRDVLRRWSESGPVLSIVTRGGDGAYAIGAQGEAEVGAPSVDVVDTVGAGDSFMAALLQSLHVDGLLGAYGRDRIARLEVGDVVRCLQWSVRAASITVQRPGADPPSLSEVSRSGSASAAVAPA